MFAFVTFVFYGYFGCNLFYIVLPGYALRPSSSI